MIHDIINDLYDIILIPLVWIVVACATTSTVGIVVSTFIYGIHADVLTMGWLTHVILFPVAFAAFILLTLTALRFLTTPVTESPNMKFK